MARIPRVAAKIFGLSAGAVPGGIGVFGSLAEGTPTESINIATIQAAASWALGWGSALVNLFPAQEDMNSIPFVLSQQIAEILQDGIPPYDSNTEYFQNSFCSFNGVIYISLVDNNTGNQPDTSGVDWAPYKSIFWVGTEAGAINAFAVTGITGFPANAGIAAGTILVGVASTSNTGPSTLAVNSQAAISILDSDGYAIQSGMVTKGMTFVLIFNGTKWNLINKKKERRSWKLFGDWSGASPAVKGTGIGATNYALSGTGANYLASQAFSMTVPNVSISTDTTSGHVATFTVPTNCFQIFPFMTMYMDISSLLATHAAQSFVGFASGTPILNSTDPLANLTGWGIWSKWTSGTLTDVKLVNNDGGANSTITAMLTGVLNSSEMFVRLIKETASITASIVIGSVQTTVTSSTDIPPVTAPSSSQVVAPFVALQTNDNFAALQSVGEIYGEYGV